MLFIFPRSKAVAGGWETRQAHCSVGRVTPEERVDRREKGSLSTDEHGSVYEPAKECCVGTDELGN
jgi:hypothetical protein